MKEIVFTLAPMNAADIVPQLSRALKKRWEFTSRRDHPGYWVQNDALDAATTPRMQRISKWITLISGILCMVTGTIVLVWGILSSQYAIAPVVGGLVAIAYGLFALLPKKKKQKPTAFDRAAEKIWPGLQSPDRSGTALFTEAGMLVETIGGTGGAALYEIDVCVETEDLLLVSHNERVTVVAKAELSKGSIPGLQALLTTHGAAWERAIPPKVSENP